MDHMNNRPLSAFRRVDGAEDQIVVVQMGRADLCRGVWRIKCYLSEEAGAVAVATGDVTKLGKVGNSYCGIVITALDYGLGKWGEPFDLGTGIE